MGTQKDFFYEEQRALWIDYFDAIDNIVHPLKFTILTQNAVYVPLFSIGKKRKCGLCY